MGRERKERIWAHACSAGGLSIRDDCDLLDVTGEEGRFFTAECDECGAAYEIKAKEREDEG